MALLQGKDGSALLLKAQKEFAYIHKLQPKFNYIADLISPRVIELYQKSK